MSREELIRAVTEFPERLDAVVRAIPDGGDQPADDGEWGAAEHVRHLIAVEREIWHARLARLAVEEQPHWAWVEPAPASGFDDTPIDAILAVFRADRDTTTATLNSLDAAGWARTGVHATYGVLDVEGLLRIAIDHDDDHLATLRALGGS